MSDSRPPGQRNNVYRAVLHQSRVWHTYSSMLAIALFLFFGVTGFMLNHPEWFGLENTTTRETTFTLPKELIEKSDKLGVVEFLRANGATGAVKPFEWPGEGESFHIQFKSPKGRSDADITLPEGDTRLTIETRGIAGLMAQLHTAQDSGTAWRFLVDLTAFLLVFSSLTGLFLWQSLPKRRTLGAAALVISIVAIAVVYWLCVP